MSDTFQITDAAKIFAALAKARRHYKPVTRGAINPDGGYGYATLHDLIAATAEAHSNEGLTVIQPVSRVGYDITITTIIAHDSGATMESTYVFSGTGSPQADGSQITFYRKYAYKGILGIAEENDDDVDARRRSGPPDDAPAPVASQPAPAAKAAPVASAAAAVVPVIVPAPSANEGITRAQTLVRVSQLLSAARRVAGAPAVDALIHEYCTTGMLNDVKADLLPELGKRAEALATASPAPLKTAIAA